MFINIAAKYLVDILACNITLHSCAASLLVEKIHSPQLKVVYQLQRGFISENSLKPI